MTADLVLSWPLGDDKSWDLESVETVNEVQSASRILDMLVFTPTSLATLLFFASTVSAVWVAENFLETLRSPRPFHAQASPERNKTCVAESFNNPEIDDAENILQAIHDCNGGGHVIFAEKQIYTIASPMNLTGLTAIDLDVQGILSFPSTNLTYWQTAAFDLQYQNATSFFLLGGHDINVYGFGTIQGNGQAWWDAFVKNKALKRPVLFSIVGMQGGSVSEISMMNSPFWHNVIVNSSDVVYSGLQLRSTSSNGNFEKNTDGWDVYRSDGITIENSTVTNGDGMSDLSSFPPNFAVLKRLIWSKLQFSKLRSRSGDCLAFSIWRSLKAFFKSLILHFLPASKRIVFPQLTHPTDCVSFKPNSTSILVQNLICNGTHGISVGSLGQYASRIDYVEDILVRNISMYNSSEGARIKVWSDSYSEKSASLTGNSTIYHLLFLSDHNRNRRWR